MAQTITGLSHLDMHPVLVPAIHSDNDDLEIIGTCKGIYVNATHAIPKSNREHESIIKIDRLLSGESSEHSSQVNLQEEEPQTANVSN